MKIFMKHLLFAVLAALWLTGSVSSAEMMGKVHQVAKKKVLKKDERVLDNTIQRPGVSSSVDRPSGSINSSSSTSPAPPPAPPPPPPPPPEEGLDPDPDNDDDEEEDVDVDSPVDQDPSRDTEAGFGSR